MSYSQPNRPGSTTGGRECASEGVLRVSAKPKVAIEELQKIASSSGTVTIGRARGAYPIRQQDGTSARRYDDTSRC